MDSELSIDTGIMAGISKLGDFSAILTTTLKNVDKSVVRLQGNYNRAADSIEKIRDHVSENSQNIHRLEDEGAKQRAKLESVIKVTHDMQQNLNSQLDDLAAKISRDFVMQSSSSKMDLSTVRNQLTRSMNEALRELTTSIPKVAPIAQQVTADMLSGDITAVLMSRIDRLEKSQIHQETLDKLMAKALESDGIMQSTVDKLKETVTTLENRQIDLLEENK